MATEDETRLAEIRERGVGLLDSTDENDAKPCRVLLFAAVSDLVFVLRKLDKEERARTEADLVLASTARIMREEVDRLEAALAEERAKSVRAENRLARWVTEATKRAETAEARVAELETR